jgi:hypothetical protein
MRAHEMSTGISEWKLHDHGLLHSRQDCFGDEYGIDNEEFR